MNRASDEPGVRLPGSKMNQASDFLVQDFPVHNTARICYNERLIFKTRLNSN